VATSSTQEIIEKTREDRVRKDTGTIRFARRIVELACKHFRDRGRVRANRRLCCDKAGWR
jgi:hypothetical protein